MQGASQVMHTDEPMIKDYDHIQDKYDLQIDNSKVPLYEMAIDFDETLGAATPNPANEEFLLVQENYKYEFNELVTSGNNSCKDDQVNISNYVGSGTGTPQYF